MLRVCLISISTGNTFPVSGILGWGLWLLPLALHSYFLNFKAMAAEKLRGIFLTGIVSAGFALLVIFIVVVFTGIGEKITNSVGKDYVDEKDKVLEQSFDTYRMEHIKTHKTQDTTVIQGLGTIKFNQALIMEAIKENNK